ncbi:extracellular solute-binding protein [Butyrivibrio sp. WCD2001]|uniref:extracellular solute-binding protein n=1 Tax=Butyrivibrio sp. WCD2001 TaxID=1280681 RepID=UPI0004109114|nr:extracellular solute-binding protein [Butyrivibrio sp. WCD2001]
MKKKLVSVMLSTAVAATMLAGCGGSGADSAADTAQSVEDAATETADAVEEAAGDVADAAEDVAEDVADAVEEAADDTDYGTGEIKVWVADNVVDFTNEQIATFQSEHPEFSGYTFTVEPVGEGDAAGNMITDVEAGADVYAFAQDQIARLVTAGALEEVEESNAEAVKAENDAGAVSAATVGGTLYAYPITSDNGYFLYYDKSVVSDPSTLEGIVADCEAAGKNFYCEINSGWYQTAFFFGAGAELTYDTDDEGNFTKCNSTYASDAGVVALKEIAELASSKSFQNGSAAGEATNVGAIIDGTWDAGTVKDLFGDNYACAKLPTFEGADGKSYQMSGFGGFKLLGVKPQQDDNKLAVCDALAAFLSSEDVQLARYNAVGWGPSNLNAQQSDEVKADEALSALAEQLQYTIPQGQYPGEYWSLATSLGDSVISGEITKDSSDDDFMKALEDFQATCEGYAQ